MSQGFERLTILGSLGRKPEPQHVGVNNTFLCKMSVAVGSKDRHGNPQTTWYNVDVWEKTGEACVQFLDKGSKVLVEGIPKLITWTGDDGKQRMKLQVRALSVTFVDSRPSRPLEAAGRPQAVGAPPAVPAALRGPGGPVGNKEADDGDDYVGDADEQDVIGFGLGFVDDDTDAFTSQRGEDDT